MWLRLEGLGALALATLLYHQGGHSWILYALLFLVPDLSLLSYLAGPRAGAIVYNLAHSYAAPAVAALLAVLAGSPPAAALIWAAHIGFDRALGYGLKYPSGFADTHLGRLGRARPARDAA